MLGQDVDDQFGLPCIPPASCQPMCAIMLAAIGCVQSAFADVGDIKGVFGLCPSQSLLILDTTQRSELHIRAL